ncbi:hypothetical protein HYALB_00005411 [Hymenoscyphus albidus]|uniref:Cytochrome P450 n=1 Tax=Hymenoscyphus albidus TaxID=595503 RepID=A0A9N9LE53_9HELO|nr:hypothetical protein HYALB_00005411 [Hymenoscyphus albidus]
MATLGVLMSFLWASILSGSLPVLTSLKYLILQALYNVYMHPLSSFTGPRLWSSTRFPYLFSLWSGSLAKDVRKLHLKYGDIVRIAPDELSFARPDAWHDVYSNRGGQSALPKSSLWHSAPPGRPSSILNALDPKIHTRFRKAMESGFTEKAVRTQESTIQSYVESLISRLNKVVSAGEGEAVVDIVKWFGFTTFDLIGDLGFGESFGCLERNDFHPWVAMIFSHFRTLTLRSSLRYYPGINWLLGLAIPKRMIQKQKEHWQLTVDKINRRLNLEKTRPDLISQIKLDEYGLQGLTIPELQATSSVIIVAGSETTVSVLSGRTNYLVKNCDKLALLKNELREKFPKGDSISLTALKELPYLNAVIQEGFRLCNPTPVGQPRITPPNGATISGRFVPANIYVNVHPLTMSLSSDFFHDPNKFLPGRWLLTSTQVEKSPFYHDKRDSVQIFGVGPRSCIGEPLAWAELRLILARLVLSFDIEEVNSVSGKLKWDDQRVFTVVERKPFEVRLRKRVL